MDKLLVNELAYSWYRNNPVRQSGMLATNKLFRMLYNTFCKRNGIRRTYDDVIAQGDYTQACTELYAWYKSRYAVRFGMSTGTRGQKRTVSCHATEYTFDLLYCDDRQFRNYLIVDTPQSGSQDLHSFVLHTAVAFLVPPGELDAVLQHLGFHPLHVKNIHHLAIYYVLLAAENRAVEDSFNPFDEVRKLYLRAHDILRTQEPVPAGSYNFSDLETQVIREALFVKKALRQENFENLVALNKDALNMRHSKILADFHKLSAVFIHLFDSAGGPESWELPEAAHSFYIFVEQFCREDLSRKKYREQLTGMIDRNQKHPTRNVLILLWLYAYCFSFLPGIYMGNKTFSHITKQLRKDHPDWASAAKAYYCNSYFDVFGFIAGSGPRTVPPVFNGADFIAFINEKLQLCYGWGPLNPKLPFDYYILRFEKLVIQLDPDFGFRQCLCVRYDGRILSDIPEDVDNVPYPLVLITWILTQLKTMIAKEIPFQKKQKLSPCPLKCSLYEQI